MPRAKRLKLTLELDRHPWLRAAMAAGLRFQADQALRHAHAHQSEDSEAVACAEA
jgi:hypothetical protein